MYISSNLRFIMMPRCAFCSEKKVRWTGVGLLNELMSRSVVDERRKNLHYWLLLSENFSWKLTMVLRALFILHIQLKSHYFIYIRCYISEYIGRLIIALFIFCVGVGPFLSNFRSCCDTCFLRHSIHPRFLSAESSEWPWLQ